MRKRLGSECSVWNRSPATALVSPIHPLDSPSIPGQPGSEGEIVSRLAGCVVWSVPLVPSARKSSRVLPRTMSETMVSVKPTSPTAVRPVAVTLTPCPPCTRVAQIHSRCRGQSTSASQTCCALARTRTWAATSSGLLIRQGYWAGRQAGRTDPGWPGAGPPGHSQGSCLSLTVWSVSSPRPSVAPAPAAPLDPAAVAAALRPFGASRMLPPAAYTGPAVFRWEQQHFFGASWLCVGRSIAPRLPATCGPSRPGLAACC